MSEFFITNKNIVDIDEWHDYLEKALMSYVKEYITNESDIAKIKRAYNFAFKAHLGAFRDSKEPYIVHPVAVANILAIMHTDVSSICAGLLHDVIEDTPYNYDDIKKRFGTDVAQIVLGVTKISRAEDVDPNTLDMQIDMNNPEEIENLNRKKIAEAILKEPRSGIVKLADRTSNMLTIGYKTPLKQQSKSVETLDLYAPIANGFGIYKIQQILEDTSFKHLSSVHAYSYNMLLMKRNRLKEKDEPFLNEILQKIIETMKDNIKIVGHYDEKDMESKTVDELLNETILVGDNLSRVRIKHVYGIYDAFMKMMPNNTGDPASEALTEEQYINQMLHDPESLEKIHDLRVVKLIMKDEISCWMARMILCSLYPPIDKYQHNYIANPKSNMYKSFHETCYINGKLVQFQIRTVEQEYRDTYGFAWDLYKFNGKNAKKKILEEFKKYPLYHRLDELAHNKNITSLGMYRDLLENEVLKIKEIPVIDKNTGITIFIKEGSTIHDFVYLMKGNDGDHLAKAIVNDVTYEFPKDKNGNIDYASYPFYLKLKAGDEIYYELDKNVRCVKPISEITHSSSKKLINKPEEVKE